MSGHEKKPVGFCADRLFLLVPCPEGGKLLLQLCGAAQVLELVPVAGNRRVYSARAKRSSSRSTTPLSSCVRMTRPAACSTLFMPGKR